MRETRKAFQDAMRDEMTREVEALTGRRVIAFMSDNHIDPDRGDRVLPARPGRCRPLSADRRPGYWPARTLSRLALSASMMSGGGPGALGAGGASMVSPASLSLTILRSRLR